MNEDPPPVQAHPAGIKGLAEGTAGCLRAACHGAPATSALAGKLDADTWQSSGSCWLAADPHTAAYSLLTDHPHRAVKVSARQIMERYAPGTRATEDARCLACHSNPALAEPGKTDDARLISLRAEGVSCEACHGNAGGWLRQHTTWTGKRAAVYHDTGMEKLYDAGERAVVCAGCHVGAPAEGGRAVRDMNHDMIAAGHPRLNFDFAEYQRRLPLHWLEKDRTEKGNVLRGPDFQVKAWLVGRVAHAEAACKLLESRAERSKTDPLTPWPEFAEFNCAACHHDLQPPREVDGKFVRDNWRDRVLAGRPPGVPPWQTIWPVTPAIGLDPQRPKDLFAGATSRPHEPLAELLKSIQTLRPAPAGKVQPHAAKAASALRALRTEMSVWPDAAFVPIADGAFGHLHPGARDWDSGLQVLFGLAALDRSRPPNPEREKWFREAFEAYRQTDALEAKRWPKLEGAVQQLRPQK